MGLDGQENVAPLIVCSYYKIYSEDGVSHVRVPIGCVCYSKVTILVERNTAH